MTAAGTTREDAMRYLLLVYEDDRQTEAMPPSELRALAEACGDSDEALRQSGYLLAVEALDARAGPVVVFRRAGAVAVMEGATVVSAARLRAVVTLQARDLNEAIQVAATMPQARLGPIEVCPLRA